MGKTKDLCFVVQVFDDLQRMLSRNGVTEKETDVRHRHVSDIKSCEHKGNKNQKFNPV